MKDSTAALQKLENFDSSTLTNDMCTFNVDVVALYDSLNIDLVFEALNDAIRKYRPTWSNNFIKWLLDLVSLSLNSAYVKFHDSWYESESGVPTGGKTSVDIANITVFFIFFHLIYNEDIKPTELALFMRFVDDGLNIQGVFFIGCGV